MITFSLGCFFDREYVHVSPTKGMFLEGFVAINFTACVSSDVEAGAGGGGVAKGEK